MDNYYAKVCENYLRTGRPELYDRLKAENRLGQHLEYVQAASELILKSAAGIVAVSPDKSPEFAYAVLAKAHRFILNDFIFDDAMR